MPPSKPQSVATLGIQTVTAKQCKICNSPHRGEIEDMLVLRHRGELSKSGVRVTEKYVIELAPQAWGLSLNRTNLHTHFSKHFRVGSSHEVAQTGKRVVTKKMEAMIEAGEIEGVAPETFLETVVAIAYAKVVADPASVTLDQGMKAVAELTKRRHDEQTANLMQGLAGAIGKSLARAGRPEPETIEAETVEELPNATEEIQDSGSSVGGEQGVPSPESVDLGDEAPDDVPGHQEPSVPGLRLPRVGRDGNAVLLPGNQGEAAELDDVQ